MPADTAPGDLADDDKLALARCALFAGCNDAQREQAHAFAFVRHLPHGAFLLQPGEPNRQVYVLLEGQLAAFRDAALQRPLARFVPGDFVGEQSLLGGEGNAFYVAAQWPSRLAVLDAVRLRELMETVPRIALNVLDTLGARLRAAELRPGTANDGSLDFMATHDALTGLHNRRWIQEFYPGRLREAQQEGLAMCVAVIDVDHFDRMNQALGRAVGDAILRQLADSIRNQLPACDTLARLAGDRFAVLMPGPMADAAAACERLRGQIAGRQFALRGNMATQISVSIGVAQAAPSLDDVLEGAMAALARAKERGRNTVEPPPG